MTALVGYATSETERKKIALQKKKTPGRIFFFDCYQSTPHTGTKLRRLKFYRDILHPNNLTVVNCTHQRLRNVVHISKAKYKVFDMKIIPDHIQLRKSFSQEGYST